MSNAALGLALGAAILHALWNLLLAGARDVLAATAVALCTSLIVATPFAVLTWGVEREAIPWLAASAALELAYFFTLTAAYARAELSLVYPLARGGAPVFVLLGALATGLVPSGREALGVLAVAAGVILVRGVRGGDRLGVLLGLVIAAQIAGLHARRRGGDRAREPGAVPPARAGLPRRFAAAAVCRRDRLRAELRVSAVARRLRRLPRVPARARRTTARARRSGRGCTGDKRPLRGRARSAAPRRAGHAHEACWSGARRRREGRRRWGQPETPVSLSLATIPSPFSPAGRNGRAAPIFVEGNDF